jgi:tRNA(adenine34) deaminase
MNYNDLSQEWQTCFALSVEAFRHGSLPIGCLIKDATGKIISKERARMVYGDKRSNMTQHAEMVALSKIPVPALEQRLTLWTTVEPCPMCFGAVNVARISELHYGTRDPWAGSVDLLDGNWYMKRKHIEVHQAPTGFERIMAAFVVYAMMLKPKGQGLCDLDNEFAERWKLVIPDIRKVIHGLSDLRRSFRGSAGELFDLLSETCNG